VEQLEQKLEADHHGSDSELAAELTAMELTERMSGSQLTQLKTGLRAQNPRPRWRLWLMLRPS